MNEAIFYTVLVLVSMGGIAAVILYLVSKKFWVQEDPRRNEIMDALPNTNCGGCGFPGCSAFTDVLLEATDLANLHCPVGGNEVMKEVAEVLSLEVEEKDPFVAVVRCSGTFEHRKQTNVYDGVANCTIATNLYAGDHGCAYGCVGLGECVDSCDFNAMYMDENTGLPVVIEEACVACNACVTTCPKDIMELWPIGRKHMRIYVACKNEEKSGVARKECAVACTGCEKCADECKKDAISFENNLANIDHEKCNLCRKCVVVCEAQSIKADNVPLDSLVKLAEIRQKKIEKEKELKINRSTEQKEQKDGVTTKSGSDAV